MVQAEQRAHTGSLPCDPDTDPLLILKEQLPGCVPGDDSPSRCSGAPGEALDAAREASEILRGLARVNPDLCLSDLAEGLSVLAACLRVARRIRAGVSISRETVRIRRRLTQRDYDTHAPGLAKSLGRLAVGLYTARQLPESFTAARKSINIYRSPARRRAEAFSQGLTDALGTYASVLQWTGKEADAARIRQEREEVFRQIEEMEAGEN